MERQTILLYGKSGAGKGTQIELLKSFLEQDGSFPVNELSTGDRLRSVAQKDSFMGRKIAKEMNAGNVFPAFIPIWTWTQEFMEEFAGNEHLLLDGVARRAEEVSILETALRFLDCPSPKIVHIVVDDVWAHARLLERGRADDQDEQIARRLAWFQSDVVPAIEVWKKLEQVTVHEINGEQSREAVHADILKALNL